jgi:hypothetical protein
MWINHHTRLDAQDLISRYCAYLDSCDLSKWPDLFTPYATFECKDAAYHGRAEIAQLPQLLRECSNGQVRHLITSLIVDPGETPRDLVVRASGPVLDLCDGCGISSFHDYRFHLRRMTTDWKIAHVFVAIAQNVPSQLGSLFLDRQALDHLPVS